MAEGHPSYDISMVSDAERMERFKMYQAKMRDHVGLLNVLSRRPGQPSAEVRWLKNDAAKKLKRIVGKWHDLSLHLTCIDNDVFKKLLNEVNDVLRLHGYGSSDEGRVQILKSSNAHDGVNFNVVLDKVNDNVPNEEITADDADTQFMNVDPTDSNNLNVNKEIMDSDNFTFQGRRRKRAPSNKTAPSKKIATDSGLPLKNSYDVLAKLPAEDNPSNQTDKVKTATTPKIVPIMMKRSNDYRDLIKQINEVEKIPCKAKEAGEFIKLFCETPNHVGALTDFLDKKEKESFVIPGSAEKPIKLVIKGLPIDMDLEEIKSELVSKKFRVDKVNKF
ncbi:hypothetical protein AVEN_223697-1 [Araneus ventricosus]|uniref:Pre-C2HC domain-containing protein n=1 Tax=Araneus ventricosus TaxID=182803 RepID=A0A4Y2SNJ6_ARAVE|nr:hypothetical protein AVEN_223697-1 [Araneus ventricosus]